MGVSRSTWEAAHVMGEWIESHPELVSGDKLRVLELGSGTGLGGTHIAAYLKSRGVEFELTMTDICEKSLKVIERNLKNNKIEHPVTVQQFEWGIHKEGPSELIDARFRQEGFPMQHEGAFDLVICSDVVYLPECVEPLLDSIKYFLKPDTGRCVYCNNRIRIDGFRDQIEKMWEAKGIIPLVNEEVVRDAAQQNKHFLVDLLKIN